MKIETQLEDKLDDPITDQLGHQFYMQMQLWDHIDQTWEPFADQLWDQISDEFHPCSL